MGGGSLRLQGNQTLAFMSLNGWFLRSAGVGGSGQRVSSYSQRSKVMIPALEEKSASHLPVKRSFVSVNMPKKKTAERNKIQVVRIYSNRKQVRGQRL